MKSKFQHVLKEILEEDHPLSYSQLQGLSNLGEAELDAFRQAWTAAPGERRQQVARALAQLNEDSPDTNFRDVLLMCLDDPEEVVRAAAIDGLSDDESYNLLEHLLRLVVEDTSTNVRTQAILALGRFMYLVETTDFLGAYRQRLLQVLMEVFEDDSAPLELRRRALESMSYMTTSEAVEGAISRAYEAGDHGMHASAIHAMGHHMGERWQPLVERELENSDPEMRYEAALASGEMANPELIHHLAPLLEDRDHEVARAAIWALGEIGGTRARRLLESCLQRDEDDIRDAAEEALHTIRFYEDPMQLF